MAVLTRARTVSRLISIFATLFATFAMASEANSDEQIFALISDASTFEGQFYSVHDYCSPYAGEPVSVLTLKSWNTANEALLKDRDKLVEDIIRTNNLSTERAASLRLAVRGMVEKARRSDRLYKDLFTEANKFLPCSKRLGEKNSSSMGFKNVAPVSYQVWQRYRGL